MKKVPEGARMRRKSGTASWHMSRDAVDLSILDTASWDEQECLEYLIQVRFGSWDSVCCPHCGTIGKHYWRSQQMRWKCMGCGSTFSITSKTVFAYRKKSLKFIVTSVLMWINAAAGQPALQNKRNMDTTYNTVFTLQHRIREAILRGFNVGLLTGDLEIDGAHQSGRRAAEKRGKPQASAPLTPDTEIEALNETMLTGKGRAAARKKRSDGMFDPEFKRRLPKDRRILVVLRERSGEKGMGARSSRVAIGLTETSPVIRSMLRHYAANSESYLNTDSAPAYHEVGKTFLEHRTVDHSVRFSGPKGENNNQAEEFNWRFDRAEKGIYLNIEPKYMLDYAAETAFRSDTRRLPNGEQLRVALNLAMSVGETQFWKNFVHGKHRQVEILHPSPLPAPSSGPAKGRDPFSTSSDRPPR